MFDNSFNLIFWRNSQSVIMWTKIHSRYGRNFSKLKIDSYENTFLCRKDFGAKSKQSELITKNVKNISIKIKKTLLRVVEKKRFLTIVMKILNLFWLIHTFWNVTSKYGFSRRNMKLWRARRKRHYSNFTNELVTWDEKWEWIQDTNNWSNGTYCHIVLTTQRQLYELACE